MRSFFGACNAYLGFVKGFAKIARPLTDMTRKDSDPDFYNPTEAQLQAFKNLKKCMIAPPILALPRHGRPYIIDTDAGAYQLGCTLLQEHEEPNDWRPMGYWSYSLSDSQLQRYGTPMPRRSVGRPHITAVTKKNEFNRPNGSRRPEVAHVPLRDFRKTHPVVATSG